MFIPQSFGVTDGWALTKRQKAQESIEKAVKQRVGGEYDGEQRGYRAWHRAIYGQFKRAGLEGLEENIALATTGTAPVTLEDWDKFYSSSDRQFCYDCVLGTTKPSAHAQLQRTDENGILSLNYLHETWAKPTVANCISAFADIIRLKVLKHEDPSDTFVKLDEYFEDYFPDTGNRRPRAGRGRTTARPGGCGSGRPPPLRSACTRSALRCTLSPPRRVPTIRRRV